ncbi:hypothetical protein [Cryptosporangium aurantiacum]|nr:hypothetical protein [Cryptosporangium aurantiacum]
MVAEATTHRQSGDWRGACAAARVDVHLDLAAIRRTHGSALAAEVEAYLRCFAPDLARWHAPRVTEATGEMVAAHTLVLVRYPGTDANAPMLFLRTPPYVDGAQRLSLHFGTDRRPADHLPQYNLTWWDHARHLWDAEAAPELLEWISGGERLPFHTRDGRRLETGELPGGEPPDRLTDPVGWTEWTIRDAAADYSREGWASAGITVNVDPHARIRIWGTNHLTGVGRISALRHALDHPRAPRWPRAFLEGMDHSFPPRPVLTRASDGEYTLTLGDEADGVIPCAWWQPSPDLELLRTGQLTLPELHPLVRAALFPDAPESADMASPTVDVEPGYVRCLGTWHELGWRDGKLASRASHDPAEVARERMLVVLGAPSAGCSDVIRSWRDSRGRLPRRLRLLRAHALALARHGDARNLARLLDDGVELADCRDRFGCGLLFHAASLDDAILIRRLAEPGLALDGYSLDGLTPLTKAIRDHASVPVVRALADAGVEPGIDSRGVVDRELPYYDGALDSVLPGRTQGGGADAL